MYSAKILADSISPAGHRLTTFEICFPRIVLAEFNTHRTFSRNSASSRAIPVDKRIAAVLESPFVPEAFAANKSGMQAGEDLVDRDQEASREVWLDAMKDAVKHASRLVRLGVHKQWANRLLETFAWQTVIVSSTEWDNYWALRVSEMAQPEIMTVSAEMKKLYEAGSPQLVTCNDNLPYHLPLWGEEYGDDPVTAIINPYGAVRRSVARCARVSYLTHDGKRDPKADEALYTRLTTAGHMSPTEHVARPMTQVELALGEFCGNFRGWVQHRKEIPGEAVFGSSEEACEGTSSQPPRGYMPFLTADRMGSSPHHWICATPLCDDVVGLLYQSPGEDPWDSAADPYESPSRICRQYKTRTAAVAACWAHAARWWKGEPPKVDAIPGYRALPEGWAIFIGRDHNMWIEGPNPGDGHGKISGSDLSSALYCYADECWKQVGGV